LKHTCFTLFDNMFVGNKKKVMETLINECTQKKLAKSSNFFIWVYLSDYTKLRKDWPTYKVVEILDRLASFFTPIQLCLEVCW